MKLARLSRMMSALSLIGIAVIPVVVAFVFLDPQGARFLMLNVNHVGDALSASVPIRYRVDALAVELVPVALAMWSLWSLSRVFAHYAEGRVFGAEPLRHLNNVALALFLGVVADVVAQAPITALLSWHLGPHHRTVSLSIGSDDVSRLFIAGAVLVIARVMEEARRMADENAGFV